jgi:predicted dehydrogenase/NADPH:quinone reductase-like Zn-dependent oxidoreductase
MEIESRIPSNDSKPRNEAAQLKQVLQNLGTGETLLADVSPPQAGHGLLCKSLVSLVSLGTEKMLVDFGKSSLLAKARAQPDKVKQVLQKVKTDGLWTTIDAVRAKLDTPIPLGYCNVGVVKHAPVGSVLKSGDRIASNGPHVEFFAVGENLAAKIPSNVSDEQAAFTVIGAIALQGVRLAGPTLGERIVVFGLGLIGLLAVQILKANGCQVLGIDFDEAKLKLAESFGARVCRLAEGQDPIGLAEDWTEGIGVDAVIITASTKSDELIHQAATMSRQRGRIILVGVVGLNLQRADFYEKELTFQVSCSYGPGRYDETYEKRGLDYPIGFVRWTEKRNFEAVLQLMAEGKIDVQPLITHRFKFDDALKAYEAIHEKGAMGILLEYGDGVSGEEDEQKERVKIKEVETKRDSVPRKVRKVARDVGVAFIGAGGFSTRMLMPLLPKQGIRKVAVASNSGVSAAHAAKKFGFGKTTTNTAEILSDPAVDAVFITTPHNLHARMVIDALEAGKHVFVEKPLALTEDDLKEVESVSNNRPDQLLLIGFNRRFSPHMVALKDWLRAAPSNKAVVITVNAGAIPEKHWTQNRAVGGGRIVGEACHFIDLARYLVGHQIRSSAAFPIQGGDGRLGDCTTLQLTFEDGSTASIHYLANGHKDFPKERVEVFAGGRIYTCDNFRYSREIGGRRKLKTPTQDKGHKTEIDQFIKAIREGADNPIPYDELIEVSRQSISLAQAQ